MSVVGSDSPRDYERRSLALAVAAGLILVLRGEGSFFSYVYGGRDIQIWLFVVSIVAFLLCVCLCLLAVVPEWRNRLPWNALREQSAVFTWAFGLFVLGVVLMGVGLAEAAIDARDRPNPFG